MRADLEKKKKAMRKKGGGVEFEIVGLTPELQKMASGTDDTPVTQSDYSTTPSSQA